MAVRNDLDLYEEHAADWWGAEGSTFRSLRQVGRFHLERICEHFGPELDGARLVELGCGGGFLALELAAHGAQVEALDLSPASVLAARGEAERRGSTVRFQVADLCAAPFQGESFDLATMTDVLEHVDDPGSALIEAARLLRPGGRLFVNTFDRTFLAALFVVHLGEGLGFVPRGTHDPQLFVRPIELQQMGMAAGLRVESLGWERPDLWRTLSSRTVHLRSSNSGFGYHAVLVKEDGA